MNSVPSSSGRLPVRVQPPSGRGRMHEVACRLVSFVLGEVAVGVGEGFPGAGSAFELVERTVDGVIQQ